MFHIALFEPEIPPNTGNVIRLCANVGATLHLIGKLGFELDDARLRRAGLDYHEYTDLRRHEDIEALRRALPLARLIAFSTRGRQRYDEVRYADDDVLLFGSETRGLPDNVLDCVPAAQRAYIPQQPYSRSLNLSNAVAVGTYEAWRQLSFVN